MQNENFLQKIDNQYNLLSTQYQNVYYSIDAFDNADKIFTLSHIGNNKVEFNLLSLKTLITQILANSPSKIDIKFYEKKTYSPSPIASLTYIGTEEEEAMQSLKGISEYNEEDKISKIKAEIYRDFDYKNMIKENAELKKRLEELEVEHKGLAGVEVEKNDLLERIEELEERLEKSEGLINMGKESVKKGVMDFAMENPGALGNLLGIKGLGRLGKVLGLGEQQVNTQEENQQNIDPQQGQQRDELLSKVLDVSSNLSEEDLSNLVVNLENHTETKTKSV